MSTEYCITCERCLDATISIEEGDYIFGEFICKECQEANNRLLEDQQRADRMIYNNLTGRR